MKQAELDQLQMRDDFISRHIGPDESEVAAMLATLGEASLEDLMAKAVPKAIISSEPLAMPGPMSEVEALGKLRRMASANKVSKSHIGLGYYGCHTPPVIQRNLLEDPAWYTAYTPYQAEIAQGRLEGLLNFQTMVCDLTGMEIANASLLDEATAAAEAMTMCHGLQQKNRKKRASNNFFVMDDCFPQTCEVLETRAQPQGIELVFGEPDASVLQEDVFAILLCYPSGTGAVRDFAALVTAAHERDILVVVTADLLSLLLLKPPGEWGADVVVGSSQRFGVPLGFGGPHAAFFATREAYKRSVPGRIVGVSIDRHGKPALRLALQTREQHIRREKATSNICTSQVLLAVIAGMYAVYHGPRRLTAIATRVHRFTSLLAIGLKNLGLRVESTAYFDTITIGGADAAAIRARALEAGINLRYHDDGKIGISLDETTTPVDIAALLTVFAGKTTKVADLAETAPDAIPDALRRTTPFLTHPVFHAHQSETKMLRYLTLLSSRDLSLAHSMIPLGSCTMKLNATTEMLPITWPEFAQLHPFTPADQVSGYASMIAELEQQLAEITGFPAISLQPNAGSQGEYSGLLVIRRYHYGRGDSGRNICIIPGSAHGTNPASAVMAGMKVVVVRCDDEGNIDLEDLRAKAETHADALGALMITYPSTHGVFEETIVDICEIIHKHGGLVYMDGANMNALVGMCKPGHFGADVIHLNLHKTFAIPHGGGGPGMGPIGVVEKLRAYLPGHRSRPDVFPPDGPTAVSAAPWGSAGILPISWAYITLLGAEGLLRATQIAVLSANYIAKRLENHYPVLYKGANGLVAHECIIDARPLKDSAGVEVEDLAKRLMDYGFHAPTMSWPVVGTLMIEPTESESKEELDRFCDAMIAMRREIAAIEAGEMDRTDNPLKNAPHVIGDLVGEWDHPYSREQAAYPLPWLSSQKFWPTVSRINNAHGDKNLVCSCLPVAAYE